MASEELISLLAKAFINDFDRRQMELIIIDLRIPNKLPADRNYAIMALSLLWECSTDKQGMLVTSGDADFLFTFKKVNDNSPSKEQLEKIIALNPYLEESKFGTYSRWNPETLATDLGIINPRLILFTSEFKENTKQCSAANITVATGSTIHEIVDLWIIDAYKNLCRTNKIDIDEDTFQTKILKKFMVSNFSTLKFINKFKMAHSDEDWPCRW